MLCANSLFLAFLYSVFILVTTLYQIYVIVIPIKVILRHQLHLLKLEAELKHIIQYLLIVMVELQLKLDHKDQQHYFQIHLQMQCAVLLNLLML